MYIPAEIIVRTKSISAGDGFICAVSKSNLVYCWDSLKIYINGVNSNTLNKTNPKRIIAGSFIYCYLDDKLDLNCADKVNMYKMKLEGYKFKDFSLCEPVVCAIDQ